VIKSQKLVSRIAPEGKHEDQGASARERGSEYESDLGADGLAFNIQVGGIKVGDVETPFSGYLEQRMRRATRHERMHAPSIWKLEYMSASAG